jgi:polyhydroxyalkanoate synthase
MYLENKLRQPGALTTAGSPVDLGAIDAPAFIFGSREDHIVPWETAFKSMGILNTAKPKHNRFVLGASGHIAGVINPAAKGKRSYWTNDAKPKGKAKPLDAQVWIDGATEHKGSWWPEWSAFLADHGGADVQAPAAPGNAQYRPIEPAPGRYVKVRAD